MHMFRDQNPPACDGSRQARTLRELSAQMESRAPSGQPDGARVSFFRKVVPEDFDQPPATGTAATPCRLRMLGRSSIRLIHASMLLRLLPNTSIPISFRINIRGA